MTLIRFALLLSGILFVIRTLHVFRERGLVREGVVTKTGTTLLAALTYAEFSRNYALILPVALLCPAVFIALEHRQVQQFRARIPLFIDRWILNLRIGNSVRAARDAALRDECAALQALLRPLFETRGGERSGHLLLSPNMRRALEEISNTDHAALERLENLRRVLRKTSEFRRKSGQAVRQSAIQAALMVVLLIAIAAYTGHRYGWTRSADLITVAFVLSLVGVVVMHLLARKGKWKI